MQNDSNRAGRVLGAMVSGFALLALSLLVATAASAGCADDAVPVGDICVDKYEASVWSTPPGVLPETQYGLTFPDYPCGRTGQDCDKQIFARSQAGARPANEITWFQAAAACVNVGKRLLTNAEWQMAVAGTPNSGAADDQATDCNTNSGARLGTGTRSKCKSAFGAYDMVGNLWEWVADWVALSETCPGWGAFSDDLMCLAGANTQRSSPGALARGGDFASGAAGGAFTITGDTGPQAKENVGFRCARERG